MSQRKIIMGIDTSNYTTSCALMYSDGELIANLKIPLPVKAGEVGLRQSEAVFSHIKNIPEIMKKAKEVLCGKPISAIGVSTRPRNIDGSYMPCFLCGKAAAHSVSAAMGIPVCEFSHQCGHIMAAIYSSGAECLLDGRQFAAFHISGGTTELLRVRFNGKCFEAELLGGTNDLNAGQVIDRVGTKMGFPFPAGVHIENSALENTKKIPGRKPKVNGFEISLSGLENLAMKLYSESSDKSLVSAFVLDYIGEGISSLCDAYIQKYGESVFVFAGGVMSDSIIKEKLKSRFPSYFASREMSADNAVGFCALTLRNL